MEETKKLNLAELEELQRQASYYPFFSDGWEYTRETSLKSIRYKDPRLAYWPIRSNISFALKDLGLKRKKDWEKQLCEAVWSDKSRVWRFLHRFRSAWSWLWFTQDHLPDGCVNDGIYTVWEEAGQHVAAFSPSVTPELTRLAIIGWHAENPEN